MNLPSQSLLILLKFAKGDLTLNEDVINAGLEVLKYCWHVFTKTPTFAEAGSDQTIEECLTQALDEGESSVKAFTPSIWVTIGLWVLEKILTKLAK